MDCRFPTRTYCRPSLLGYLIRNAKEPQGGSCGAEMLDRCITWTCNARCHELTRGLWYIKPFSFTRRIILHYTSGTDGRIHYIQVIEMVRFNQIVTFTLSRTH